MVAASKKLLPSLAVQVREIENQIIQRKRIVLAAVNRRLTFKADREGAKLETFEAILKSLLTLQGNSARSESEK